MVEEKDNDKINPLSEMTLSERAFIKDIIRTNRPKKILEVGVAAGGTSVLMLNILKDIKDATLYSHDCSVQYYKEPEKNTGFNVDDYPELKKQWKFFAGGMVCNYLDEIGGEIDICFLDTVHSNPGEFLDYLQILPYMKKNGIIIIHDIALSTMDEVHINCTTCCSLFSSIKGKKTTSNQADYTFFPNIGTVVLDDDAYDRAFDVFNCLKLPWAYMLGSKDISLLYAFFKRHYKQELADLFLKSAEYYQGVIATKEALMVNI